MKVSTNLCYYRIVSRFGKPLSNRSNHLTRNYNKYNLSTIKEQNQTMCHFIWERNPKFLWNTCDLDKYNVIQQNSLYC